MHTQDPRGTLWWGNLSPWQKMAVVRYFPNLSADKMADMLQLESSNSIGATRMRINNRIREKKPIPEPCSPENVGRLTTPRGIRSKLYIQKPQPEPREVQATPAETPPKPIILVKPTRCCEKGCSHNAVHTLAFCKEHARKRYTMTPQIEKILQTTS